MKTTIQKPYDKELSENFDIADEEKEHLLIEVNERRGTDLEELDEDVVTKWAIGSTCVIQWI